MVAFLALAPGGSATREKLAGLLWSDRQEEQARGSLRQSVTELRAAFRGRDEEALQVDRDSLHIRLDKVWIDARELERLAVGTPEERRQVIALYGGDLLADIGSIGGPFDDWLYSERAFRRDTALNAMASLLRERLAAGDVADAEAMARAVLTIDPAHEEAHRAVMESYARRGDKSSALRQFQIATETLKRVLDAKPGPATVTLYERIKGDRLTGDSGGPASTGADGAAQGDDAQAVQLSVAVLPFRNIGGDPTQDYLGDGLADEIVDGLSRFRWLSVIASGSTGIYRGVDADPRDVGQRLNVRYAVEGAVRRSAERVRIAVRLVDCDDGRTVWSDMRVASFAEVFELENDIVREIVGQLDPKLLQAEIDRARRRPPENRNAYDNVLRAVPLMYQASAESFRQAGEFLRRAVTLDPDYARAHAWLAFWHVISLGEGWVSDSSAKMVEAADHHARIAVERDPDDAMGLAFAAHVEGFLRRQFDSAERLYERALTLNPSFGWAWALRAVLCCYRGRPDEALGYMSDYHKLCPFDPYRYFWDTVTTIAHALKGQHEQALVAAAPVLRDHPMFGAIYVPVISSLGRLGRIEEGRALFEKLKVTRPDFSIESFRKTYPMENPEDFDAYIQGLRDSGVPEI
jgi:TolB-like protein/Tfp pilus assembly protein PilF